MRFSMVVFLAVLTSGCVVSQKPLFRSSSKVVPFVSGSRYEVYQRDRPDQAWKKKNEEVTLKADAALRVSAIGLFGGASNPESRLIFNVSSGVFVIPEPEGGQTIHALGDNLFVIVSEHTKQFYSYSTFEIRDKEALITGGFCGDIDAEKFKKSRGTISSEFKLGDVCVLDKLADAVAFLKELARHPKGPQLRLVLSQKTEK